ncbi:Oxygen-dependent choline dehydrogenase [Phytophthora cinnamomi]|uniref:Oxygen-dependent choline dehydrogenase n=1 Tax=Phytophthora cinnamomi TaxID=4785 RepID=UPI003559FC99|nr:Oxygen-dependent choline dehydrogenase [Phytophthora cinnamomi]
MLVGTALSSAVALLVFASHAEAHGHLKQPEPTFEDGASTVEWVTLIDNYWDIGSGGDQVGKFKTMAKEKGMSVRDVVLDMVKDKKCGYTRTDVDPKPVPTDGKATWWGNGGGGFTHTGPCEIYIDDKMVLHGDDCEEEYPGGPNGSNKLSEMPVDYSSCNGECTLAIYWLGFQNAQWQAYVNCVPLKGSGGSTTQQNRSSTTDSSTGGQTTETPSSGTQSASGSSTQEQSKETPAATPQTVESPSTETQTTDAPSAEAPETEAPSANTPTTEVPSTETTDSKCKAPGRRLRKKVAAV